MFMPFGISALLPKNSNRSVGEADAGIVIVVFANFILVPVIFGLGTLILASLKVSSPSKKAIIAACAFTVVATAYMLTSL